MKGRTASARRSAIPPSAACPEGVGGAVWVTESVTGPLG